MPLAENGAFQDHGYYRTLIECWKSKPTDQRGRTEVAITDMAYRFAASGAILVRVK